VEGVEAKKRIRWKGRNKIMKALKKAADHGRGSTVACGAGCMN
jgi:hypothetical protein